MRKENICATEIQRVTRGKLARLKYKDFVSRAMLRRKEELDRLARLRRIRVKERELALLRRIPATDFLSLEKIRRDRCARIVQQAWRHRLVSAGRGHLTKEGVQGGVRGLGAGGVLLNGVNVRLADVQKQKDKALLTKQRYDHANAQMSNHASPQNNNDNSHPHATERSSGEGAAATDGSAAAGGAAFKTPQAMKAEEHRVKHGQRLFTKVCRSQQAAAPSKEQPIHNQQNPKLCPKANPYLIITES